MAKILKGAPVAEAITEQLVARAADLKNKGIIPTLAIVRAGERGGDIAYETGAVKRCDKIGIAVKRFPLPADCPKEKLLDTIKEINEDETIHGCLVFRPLSDRETEAAAAALLLPEKDVDCMTASSLAGVLSGRGAGYPPCTAAACIELLDYYGIELEGRRVTVIGRSLVIGRPVSMLLQARNATVTMCHTKTADLPSVCREAEILVVAAGKAGVVSSQSVLPGQIVIDVGINMNTEGKLCGDVDFAAVEPTVSAITPVPGGVGAVTTAVLAKHVIKAAERALEIAEPRA
ncbi:MAG: tetrahydrofolate dehydrogenase/cyclohydrolase catalytic domain-containing protein [Oscillospiraceae bacterium]|nr:tetrahydrofolate dehydrogenase/cyclohydrolase catalytic domain-containing protein [Oscillospiraceae bacterium]